MITDPTPRRTSFKDPWHGTLVVTLSDPAIRPYHLASSFRNTDAIRLADNRLALYIRLALERHELDETIKVMLIRVWVANGRFTKLQTYLVPDSDIVILSTDPLLTTWGWETYVTFGLKHTGG
jgi:hypothetical protein